MESAPKSISVEGLTEFGSTFDIGNIEYDIDNRAIQTFRFENSGVAVNKVKISVNSNWGNPNYTCLYRVRVHGREL